MKSVMKREGWVPARLKLRGEDTVVDWCWIGSERFTEPFFDQTIANALQRPFNKIFVHRTPIAELCEWQSASPGIQPTGFIFHMSRCGSTLVSQMLATLPDAVVISEASPLDWLARTTAIPEETRAMWFRAMVSALGQRRWGGETRYFIKFDSMTVLALPFIRRVFPEVPWIFLYRDPEEVLMSQLRDPAPAMSPGFVIDVRALEIPMEEVLSMPVEEYAARVMGRLCDCAIRGMDQLGIPVNYKTLPDAVWGMVASHFHTVISDKDLGKMRELINRDAKRPSQKFEGGGSAKRDDFSDALCEAAVRWMAPAYTELERLAIAQPTNIG